jgi:hypothetical protein
MVHTAHVWCEDILHYYYWHSWDFHEGHYRLLASLFLGRIVLDQHEVQEPAISPPTSLRFCQDEM